MKITTVTQENVKEYTPMRKHTALPIGDMLVKFMTDHTEEVDEAIEASDLEVKSCAVPLQDILGIEWFNNPLLKAINIQLDKEIEDYKIDFLRKPFENSRGKTYSQPYAIRITAKA